LRVPALELVEEALRCGRILEDQRQLDDRRHDHLVAVASLISVEETCAQQVRPLALLGGLEQEVDEFPEERIRPYPLQHAVDGLFDLADSEEILGVEHPFVGQTDVPFQTPDRIVRGWRGHAGSLCWMFVVGLAVDRASAAVLVLSAFATR
jgi:hypothetical protein